MGILRATIVGTAYGNSDTVGGGQALEDNNNATYVNLWEANWFNPPGRIEGKPKVSALTVPSGRKVISVRLGHTFTQPTNYRGWPWTYLRAPTGAVYSAAQILAPDGYRPNVVRTQYGNFLPRPGGGEWTLAEISNLTMVSTVVPENYASGARDTRLTELWLDIIYTEALIAPSAPLPGGTIATSNPELSVVLPSPQAGQPVRAIFEVARDNAFTTEKRTFVSGFSADTAAGARVRFTGQPDLGPGVWYIRAKGQDELGTETAFTAAASFTITHAALPAPTFTGPAPGSIVVNPYVIRSGRVDTAASDNRSVALQFQFSPVATFDSGVVTHTTPTSGAVRTGTVAYDPAGQTSQKLPQGNVFARVRAVDRYGQTSPWSTVENFTVQHQPVAQNVSPTNNTVIDQTVTPVRWTFGDPWSGDSPTAYQIRVYREDGTMVYDTGKVAGQALQRILAVPTTYLYERLRYTVALWDVDDVTSSTLSSYYFVFSTSPQITMSFPAADEAIATGQPTFRWTPGINRPGASQRSYELKVYNRTSGNLIYTSGVVNSSTAREHTPPQTILSNGGSYQLTLRIVDSDGLNSTLIRNFTASYQAPPQVILTVDPLTALEGGYVNLDWGLTVPDDYFINWRVYRREAGDIDWTPVATIDDSSVTTYHDWFVPKVGDFQYTVTQVADRFGYVLESAPDENAPIHYIRSEDFWIIDPTNEANNIRVYSVAGHPYVVEYERADYIVKGRGRKVNYGTRKGVSGTMECKVRPRSGYTPTELINQVEEIVEQRRMVILRDPFGRAVRMAVGDISVTPMAGTGPDEFADLSIPYQEVY